MVFFRTLVIGALLLAATPARSIVSEPTPSQIHNNTIAIAVPLSNISIDGDLSDWPNDLPIYKLREREYALSPVDANGALLDTSADCSPHFRVGYNLQDQSIYVAIETRDDTLFAEDASVVYLHTTLEPGKEPLRYYREYHSEGPTVSNMGFFDDLFFSKERLAKSGIRSAVSRDGDTTVYEWGLKLSSSDTEKISTNQDTRFLFNIGVRDVDNKDGWFSLGWSQIPDKKIDVALLGSLRFTTQRSMLVHFEGTLLAEDKTPLPAMKIRFENDQGSWVNEVITGAEGHFSTWSPPGNIQITVRGLATADTVLVKASPGTRHRLNLTAPYFSLPIRPVIVSAHERHQLRFLLEGARFRIGDDPSWSASDYDDSDWESFDIAQPEFNAPQQSNVIWVRQHLIAESESSGIPLVISNNIDSGRNPFSMERNMSTTYFLNGSRLSNFNPSTIDTRALLNLDDEKPQLLAARFYFGTKKIETQSWRYNFRLDPATSVQEAIRWTRSNITYTSLFVGMPLILSIVHSLMFWFYRKQREHIFYAILLFNIAIGPALVAGNAYFNWGNHVVSLVHASIALVGPWALVRLIREIFHQPDSRAYSIFLGSSVAMCLLFAGHSGALFLAYTDPFELGKSTMEGLHAYYRITLPLSLVVLAITLMVWRRMKNPTLQLASWSALLVALSTNVSSLIPSLYEFNLGIPLASATIALGCYLLVHSLYRAFREHMFGASTVTAGVTVYFLSLYGSLFLIVGSMLSPTLEALLANIEEPATVLTLTLAVGNFALIGAGSFHLARIVGRTGHRLEGELIRVETLSKTNLEQERALRQRMEEELEEAHQLQISMLPNHVPEHPAAEVDWAMKTATEVGGDYFDYRIADDDRLTLVLGDATGHGMQAGTLVTATKSLFQSLTTDKNLADTVSKMSASLKSMNLNRLGMALTMVELDGHRLRYCAAGIPPILIYRAKNDMVEEGETGGLPLGLTTRGSYQQTELTLESGDAFLLMSDGLPERINEAEEEFGYQRVQELFHKVAKDTPAEVCRKMAAAGDAWADGKEQDDDVSFLAVRIR